MGLSKVYRGYVIEQRGNTGQWYILNAPTYTNSNFFSPGPHGGWSVATHQVDILIDHVLKGEQSSPQQRQSQTPHYSYEGASHHSTFGENLKFYLILFAFLGIYSYLVS